MVSVLDTRSRLIRLVCVCGAVYGLALYARLSLLTGFVALQDSIGPFWAALRFDGRAHADPYGVVMLAPYWLIVWVAGSLWSAVNWLAMFHAVVAPVITWLSVRHFGAHWVSAGLIGSMVAMDPGLLDTFQSGSKGYFSALFLGLATVGRGNRSWFFFACAVGNHPMALAGLPLVLRPTEERTLPWIGLSLFCGLLWLQASGWGSPGVEGQDHDVFGAMSAYVAQGGATAWLIGIGPMVGLLSPKTRSLAIRVLASCGILLILGLYVDYLRDHHLRLLTLPALLCWSSVARWSWLALSLGIIFSTGDARPPESSLRGSTLGLVSQLGRKVSDLNAPMIVDRAWISGGPAVEPGALMLDLYLRDWGPIEPGTNMVLVIAGTSSEREEFGPIGSVLLEGHGYEVVLAPTRSVLGWSEQLCDQSVRVGGAWDALSSLNPDAKTEAVQLWWECP